jgi:F-type H+-transporting ATPase subunit alpha
MKQSQYSPLSVADMAISLFAANEGFLDEVPLDKIIAFEKALHEFSSDKHSDLVNEINTNCDYNDEVAAKLKSLMEDFKEKGVY